MSASQTPKRKRVGTRKPRTRKKKENAEERYLAIQRSAYLKAEKNDFRENPVDYWLAAEKEFDSPSG